MLLANLFVIQYRGNSRIFRIVRPRPRGRRALIPTIPGRSEAMRLRENRILIRYGMTCTKNGAAPSHEISEKRIIRKGYLKVNLAGARHQIWRRACVSDPQLLILRRAQACRKPGQSYRVSVGAAVLMPHGWYRRLAPALRLAFTRCAGRNGPSERHPGAALACCPKEKPAAGQLDLFAVQPVHDKQDFSG